MFIRGLAELYSWFLPGRLAHELEARNYSVSSFLGWFWQSRRFPAYKGELSDNARSFQILVLLGSLGQIIAGVWLLVAWAQQGTTSTLEFGAALLLSYPIVWTHVSALLTLLGKTAYLTTHPKKLGRNIVCSVLERQVRQLRKRHKFKVVAVAGSVGKTSTKLAIADLLAQSLRVRHQTGNYNDRVTVPLIFFGQSEPNLLNIAAWLKIFRANRKAIHGSYPFDVVVVELGTDGPGFMREFAYTKPDIAVLTAVAPEHMEFFGTLDAVAAEELVIFDYAKQVLVNGDDIAGEYLAGRNFLEYSTSSNAANYYTKPSSESLAGQTLDIKLAKGHVKAANVQYIGWHGAKFALAAAGVADMLGVSPDKIKDGLKQLKHFAGRMQVLPGLKDSTLIDDTYNASPVAVKAALDVLYAAKTKQRIAILGNMNELGDYSRQAHEEVGKYCYSKKLDLVVTIGVNANKYLAPAAKKKGCTVKTFDSPYKAGEYVKSQLKTGAVVLAKGSQNGVFAEEALKSLLRDKKDQSKLVRQSDSWLKTKARQFPQ